MHFFIYIYIYIITDTDFADDIALLANTPVQVKTRLHNLERAVAGIAFYVYPDKR